MGGDGPEREVSLNSGEGVFNALKECGYLVEKLDVRNVQNQALSVERMDLAFLALHGGFGEDGRIQRVLEARDIRYTGSGPDASALAMDKMAAKACFTSVGLHTPLAMLAGEDAVDWAVSRPGKVVIKPVASGSSCGITLVDERENGCEDIVRTALSDQKDGALMLEDFVQGRELTVGILDQTALPVIELVVPGDLYDYHAKYIGQDTQYTFPMLSSDLDRMLKETARRAFCALECRDFARVDIMLDEKDKAWVLEVNTLPGMTPRSLLPKAAQKAGMDFSKLCASMVTLALKR